MDIKSLIGEATEYDKKLALEVKRPKSCCKSVSAFANGSGGMLVFGISDNDEIIGLDDAEHIAEPLLADFFNRLELMERRGSGVKKIVNAYKFYEEMPTYHAPEFRSDQQTFTLFFGT